MNELPMTNLLSPVESPCIGDCRLDDKDMCLGCFRMMNEILIWSKASPKQQLDIVQACATRKREKSQTGLG